MGQRDNILAIAKKEIGYTERNNNNNKYGAAFKANNQPWCAYFVSWCADKAQIPKSIIPVNGYVPGIVSYYQKKGLFKKRSSYIPKYGDLIIFDFNRNGTGDHIGIVEKVSNDKVYTIEGNTSKQGENANGDGVWNKYRSLSYGGILGYCAIKYEDDIKEVDENNMKRYDKASQVPIWGKATIEKLVKLDLLKGDENGNLDLSHDMLRIYVSLDRKKIFD